MTPNLELIMSIRNRSVQKYNVERNQKHLKGQRRARFSQRRTTTFVTEDDSLRLKQLQGKSIQGSILKKVQETVLLFGEITTYLDRFEVKQAKQLEKQNSAAELIKEKEDTLVKGSAKIVIGVN